jgi:heme exporter protein D
MSFLLNENPSPLFFIWLLLGATLLSLIPSVFSLLLDKRDQKAGIIHAETAP